MSTSENFSNIPLKSFEFLAYMYVCFLSFSKFAPVKQSSFENKLKDPKDFDENDFREILLRNKQNGIPTIEQQLQCIIAKEKMQTKNIESLNGNIRVKKRRKKGKKLQKID